MSLPVRVISTLPLGLDGAAVVVVAMGGEEVDPVEVEEEVGESDG